MSGFVLHPEAFKDLDEFWEFIARDSLNAADRVLEEIHEAIRRLVLFPELGHARSDLTSRPLRFHDPPPRCKDRPLKGQGRRKIYGPP
jgi:plasmid stabilization system protein ParE